MEIDWSAIKEIVYKAAFAGGYAAVAELALTQTADKDTLMLALVVAGVRGLSVFFMNLYDAWKPMNLDAKIRAIRLRDLL